MNTNPNGTLKLVAVGLFALGVGFGIGVGLTALFSPAKVEVGLQPGPVVSTEEPSGDASDASGGEAAAEEGDIARSDDDGDPPAVAQVREYSGVVISASASSFRLALPAYTTADGTTPVVTVAVTGETELTSVRARTSEEIAEETGGTPEDWDFSQGLPPPPPPPDDLYVSTVMTAQDLAADDVVDVIAAGEVADGTLTAVSVTRIYNLAEQQEEPSS